MVTRVHVFFILFVIWAFAFIFSPYWHIFGTFGFPFFKYVSLVLLSLFGLVWAYLASSDVRLPKIKIEIPYLILLSVVLYLVNLNPLRSDIAWRGDESFHISLILSLIGYFTFFWEHKNIYLTQNPLFWALLFLTLFVVSYFFSVRFLAKGKVKKIFIYLLIGISLLLILLSATVLFPESAFTDQKDIFLLSDLLRYPFIEKWVNLLFVVPNVFGDIRLFRAVPFLSMLALAVFLFYVFNQTLRSTLLSFLFSFVLTTVPLILFYGTILYLEMSVIFLMTVCVFHIRTLMQEDFEKLKSHPVWYCLLLISFLKETAFIFLVLVLFLRVAFKLWMYYRLKVITKVLWSEIKLAILVMSPVLAYLLLRQIFLPEFARYNFYVQNILFLKNYGDIVQALITQTGLLVIIGMVGFIYLIWKRDTFHFVVFTVLIGGVLLFFLGYQYIPYILSGRATIFVGYSRWNLYLLPMIFFAAFYVIVRIKKSYQIFMFLLLISSNILLFPFKADGVRLPNWGSPNTDVAEYTYPYNEAIRFLSIQKQTKTLLVLGQYSPYWGLRYYFEKYNFHPKTLEHPFGSIRFDEKTERQNLDSFFDKPQILADTILYHSVNGIDLDMSVLYGGSYKIIKKVQNSLHSIYLFQKV